MAPVQLFLRNLEGTTRTLWASPEQSVLELKGCVEAKEGIPWHAQGLVFQGHQLQDEESLSRYGIAAESTVHLVLGLRGGKGGFGALLRGLGRDGKGLTTNFDACRDLSGRRVRHTTLENKLKEWKASAPERELEKLAEQHMKEMARQQRREEEEKVDLEPLLNEHEQVIEESRRAVQEAIAGGKHTQHGKQQQQASQPSSSGQQSQLQGEGAASGGSPQAAGSKRARGEGASSSGGSSDSEASGSGNSGSGSASNSQAGSGVGKKGGGGGAAPVAKKPKMLAMLEDVGVSSGDEDSSDEEGDATRV